MPPLVAVGVGRWAGVWSRVFDSQGRRWWAGRWVGRPAPAISVRAMRAAGHPKGLGGGGRRSRSQRSQAPTKRDVVIKLSGAQVAQVFREAAGGSGMGGFLFRRIDDGEVRESLAGVLGDPAIRDPGISRSMVIGYVILCALTPPGRGRGVIEIARELGTAPSTTHRYIRTLVVLGLVEQIPDERKYRLALDLQRADTA